jgi:hypothetical protein
VTLRGGCVAAIVALTATLAVPARAQDPAAAVTLFQNGVSAMQAENYAEGCPALEESYRLEPLPGVLFTSAECHAKWGKVATAVARYRDYLTVFERLPPSQVIKQGNRNQVAKRQIEILTPKVPQLTLILPDGAPAHIKVTRDGVLLGRPSLSVALPVDPGEHLLTTETSGAVHEQRVTLEEGESKRVLLEFAQPESSEAKPSAPAAPPARDLQNPTPGKATSPWLWVAGGVGVAGVAVGSVTGALVFSKKSTVDENCRGPDCNHEGKQAADSAKTLGLVSTISFAVGAAGIATAAVLLLTLPHKERAATRRPELLVGGSARSAFIGLTKRF